MFFFFFFILQKIIITRDIVFDINYTYNEILDDSNIFYTDIKK